MLADKLPPQVFDRTETNSYAPLDVPIIRHAVLVLPLVFDACRHSRIAASVGLKPGDGVVRPSNLQVGFDLPDAPLPYCVERRQRFEGTISTECGSDRHSFRVTANRGKSGVCCRDGLRPG